MKLLSHIDELLREYNERKILVWSLLVIKIIIEMLVNGMAPFAVSNNLESIVRLITPTITIEELPNIDFVRKSRGLVRINKLQLCMS